MVGRTCWLANNSSNGSSSILQPSGSVLRSSSQVAAASLGLAHRHRLALALLAVLALAMMMPLLLHWRRQPLTAWACHWALLLLGCCSGRWQWAALLLLLLPLGQRAEMTMPPMGSMV
jgi:hypothetical protein